VRALCDVACVVLVRWAQVKQEEIHAAFRKGARQQRARNAAERLRLAVARVDAAERKLLLQLAQVEAAVGAGKGDGCGETAETGF
jgi:hypothetical protein